ncbi:hypothetical protein [Massilia niabensis]|uniref:DUF2987 domain-containing protein n=1 Tax=Massilia niabensis TaxID=544910 RepID=A0ABW0L1J9_9BURK
MGRVRLALSLGALLLSNPAAAVPGKDEPDTVHVSAIRNPEIHKYKAILAGLDTFDKHRALAPGVPELRFRVAPREGVGLPEQPKASIEGERGFMLPLAIDARNRFTVPRSEAALAAEGELVLNQRRHFYQVMPDVRTPGLPDNVRRLGDLRLECKVMITIAKEEAPLLLVATLNGLLRTRDWCGFFNEYAYTIDFRTELPVVSAILSEGNRSAALKTGKQSFSIALNEPSWSDDALVELTFAAPTGTAGGTPRTAP